jgi:putative oxidoreductase
MVYYASRATGQVDIALLVLRVTTGAIFIAHGAQKLFSFGIGNVSGGFAQSGIPMPEIAAPLVAFTEFVGGIALVLGLLTRLAALGLTFVMLGAIFFVHMKNGFFLPNGVEFTVALAGAAIALVTAGAGRLSLDSAFSRRRYETAHRSDAAREEAAKRRAA